GFVTLVADEALLLLGMDTNIALVGLASGMAVLVGTECGRGVHDTPPGYAWQHCHEKYVWTPVCFTTSPHHGLVQSYQWQTSAYQTGNPSLVQGKGSTQGEGDYRWPRTLGHVPQAPQGGSGARSDRAGPLRLPLALGRE